MSVLAKNYHQQFKIVKLPHCVDRVSVYMQLVVESKKINLFIKQGKICLTIARG